MNRRNLIKGLGLAGVASISSQLLRPAKVLGISETDVAARSPGARRSIRLAQMTDVHVEPELGAGEGLLSCLHHVQSQPDKPEMILMTGDCVFDSFAHDHDRVQSLWTLWQQTWKNESSLQMHPLLGNHDIWGWNKKKSNATGREAEWGKKWACDVLGLSKPYYSFDKAGWHFIALDSVQSSNPAFDTTEFIAKLDEAQLDWLSKDLDAVDPKTPILVMSHVPILSMASIFGKQTEQPDDSTSIGKQSMHTDWRTIKTLFARHPNVKLAISGHLHLVDRVDYAGVSYLCNGAVSGGWWKERNLGECDAGYALLDLYDDGSFDHQYITYGWQYRTPTTQQS